MADATLPLRIPPPEVHPHRIRHRDLWHPFGKPLPQKKGVHRWSAWKLGSGQAHCGWPPGSTPVAS